MQYRPVVVPTRQLVWKALFASLQPHQIDHILGLPAPFVHRHALQFQRKCNVIDYIEMGHQSKILKDHAHFVAAKLDELLRINVQQIGAIQQNFTCRRFNQPGQATYDSRFAGPGKAHDDKNFASMNVKRNIGAGDDVLAVANLLSVAFGGCGIADIAVLAGKKLFRRRSVNLPDISARQFDVWR